MTRKIAKFIADVVRSLDAMANILFHAAANDAGEIGGQIGAQIGDGSWSVAQYCGYEFGR